MAQLLYQAIMGVPGLTGTWQQRNAQYYKALGSPMGAYKGTKEQNLYLLSQISKKNFPQAPAPTAQPAPVAPTPLADQYSAPGVTAGQNASATPQFEQVMPFYDAWGRMIPQATQAAASQIDPELQRGFKSNYNNYMGGMTNAGGERFGRALGGIGDLKAATERDRNAQLQDWLSSYQKGYQDIFYNPSRDAWNSAITQGKAPDQTLTNIPTWTDVESKFNTMYGITPTTPSMPTAGGLQQPAQQVGAVLQEGNYQYQPMPITNPVNQFQPIGSSPNYGMTPISDAYGGRYQTPGLGTPSIRQAPSIGGMPQRPSIAGNLIGTFVDDNGNTQNNYQYQQH